MPRKDNDVPSHDDNGGSRGYLANEVRSQGAEISALSIKVAGAEVSLATLIEDSNRGREHRGQIYRQLEASRAEIAQVMQSVVALQASLADVAKTLKEHEMERQQVKGAARVAQAVSGAGWGLAGIIIGWITIAIGFIVRHFSQGGPPPIGPHP